MNFIKECEQCSTKIVESKGSTINMDLLLDNWLSEIGADGIILEWIAENLYIAGKSSIASFQQGYAGSDWCESWIVVAKWIGDPIIYNVETKEVLTAMHGAEVWNPYVLAPSLKDFGLALAVWCKLYCEKYNKSILDDDCVILDGFVDDLQEELAKVLDRKYIDGFLKFINS